MLSAGELEQSLFAQHGAGQHGADWHGGPPGVAGSRGSAPNSRFGTAAPAMPRAAAAAAAAPTALPPGTRVTLGARAGVVTARLTNPDAAYVRWDGGEVGYVNPWQLQQLRAQGGGGRAAESVRGGEQQPQRPHPQAPPPAGDSPPFSDRCGQATRPSAPSASEPMYECEGCFGDRDCGFVGSWEEVNAHETVCPLRLQQVAATAEGATAAMVPAPAAAAAAVPEGRSVEGGRALAAERRELAALKAKKASRNKLSREEQKRLGTLILAKNERVRQKKQRKKEARRAQQQAQSALHALQTQRQAQRQAQGQQDDEEEEEDGKDEEERWLQMQRAQQQRPPPQPQPPVPRGAPHRRAGGSGGADSAAKKRLRVVLDVPNIGHYRDAGSRERRATSWSWRQVQAAFDYYGPFRASRPFRASLHSAV